MSFSEEKLASIYELENTLISKGSYGEVYRAKKKQTNETVAIKKIVIPQEFFEDSMEEIINEINVLKMLNQSTYSVKYFDCFKEKNTIYIAMEFCENNLSKLIQLNNGLTIQKIKKYFLQINELLKIMSNKNFIHRDLKPENILLKKKENDYEVKVSDYGFARELTESFKASSVKGTNFYIAPEIILKRDYKKKVDLWSLGMILYKMYFNKLPFENAESFQNFVYSQGTENLPKIEKSGDKIFDDLVEKLIVFNSENRLDWNEYFNHRFFIENSKVDKIKNDFENFKKESNKIINFLQDFFKKFCNDFNGKIVELENDKIEIKNLNELNKLFNYKFNENNINEWLMNIKNFNLKFEYKRKPLKLKLTTKKDDEQNFNFDDVENLNFEEIKKFNDHDNQKIFQIIELNNNYIATFSFNKIVIYDSQMNKKIVINLDKKKDRNNFESISELKNNILSACTWSNIYLYKLTENNYNLHQKLNFGTGKIFELKNSKIIFHDTNDEFHLMKINKNNNKYEEEFKININNFYFKDYFELKNEKILCYPKEKNNIIILDLQTKKEIKNIKFENNIKTDFHAFISHFILIEENKLLIKSKKFIHLLNLNNFEIETEFSCGEFENYFEISLLKKKVFLIGDQKGFINVYEFKDDEINFVKNVLVHKDKNVYNVKLLKNGFVATCSDDGYFKLFKIKI